MAATYDLATSVGKVRLKIGDRAVAAAHFTDEEITAALSERGGNINFAAADLLDTWASETTAVAQSYSVPGLSVSTSSQGRDMAARAQALREQEYNKPAYGTAELNLSPESAAQIVINRALRRGV